MLVATATIRVVATEGQIYGRELQQAGDYTGPHRDPATTLAGLLAAHYAALVGADDTR